MNRFGIFWVGVLKIMSPFEFRLIVFGYVCGMWEN